MMQIPQPGLPRVCRTMLPERKTFRHLLTPHLAACPTAHSSFKCSTGKSFNIQAAEQPTQPPGMFFVLFLTGGKEPLKSSCSYRKHWLACLRPQYTQDICALECQSILSTSARPTAPPQKRELKQKLRVLMCKT